MEPRAGPPPSEGAGRPPSGSAPALASAGGDAASAGAFRGDPTDRPCIEVEIPPGEAGLAALMGPLAEAISGRGPAIALVPGSGSTQYRARIRAAVRPGEPVPGGIAAIVSTSGSTGDPAGVLLPGGALKSAATGFAERSGEARHVWVAALPLHHTGGLMVAARAVIAGTIPIALPRLGDSKPFTADSFIDATATATVMAEKQGIPLAVSVVPAMLTILERAGPAGVAALRRYSAVLVGGAATSPDLVARLRSAGIRLMCSYGMTETCGGAVFDGRPLSGMSVAVEPAGRLVLAGDQVAAGYRDDRLRERWATDRAGRRTFRTEDLGLVSADGTVTVLGRADDVVQVGGASVSVGAVAEVLRADDRVADAEVVAAPDDRLGSVLVAVIVPTRGACAITPGSEDGSRQRLADSLADLVTTQLGRSGRPRHVRLVREIPMLESGKPDRRAIARLAADART